MTTIQIELEDEAVTELAHRADQTGSELPGMVRAAVELYLQLENPEEVINESDSE